MRYGLPLLLAALLIAGCSGDSNAPGNDSPVLTAATLGEQISKSNAEWLLETPFALADLDAGKRIAGTCLVCHSLAEGGPNMAGPKLYGVFGRTAGSVSGFNYSSALGEAGFVWTPRALDAWLAAPSRFLPGNWMAYPGISGASDRDNLIAYLLTATDSGTVSEGGEGIGPEK